MTRERFNKYWGESYKTLLHRANKLTYYNQSDAEDLLGDLYFKLYKSRNSFSEGTSFVAWGTFCLKNLNIDRIRKQRSFVDTNLITDSVLNVGFCNMICEEVYKAIELLPDKNKEVFNLFLQEYKYEDISKDLNIPLGTVKARIFDSRKILQERLRYN